MIVDLSETCYLSGLFFIRKKIGQKKNENKKNKKAKKKLVWFGHTQTKQIFFPYIEAIGIFEYAWWMLCHLVIWTVLGWDINGAVAISINE